MRVISGKAKGSKLKALEGLNTRPTSDRIKESLFNIIAPYIQESNVLDLFSGTGNLAIEALSRGAKSAVLIDQSHDAYKTIKYNLEHTKLQQYATVYNCTYEQYLSKFYNKDTKFDIIFIDPPYNQNFIIPSVISIANANILSSDGIIIVERDYIDNIPDNISDFEVFRNVKYGRTILSFLKYIVK